MPHDTQCKDWCEDIDAGLDGHAADKCVANEGATAKEWPNEFTFVDPGDNKNRFIMYPWNNKVTGDDGNNMHDALVSSSTDLLVDAIGWWFDACDPIINKHLASVPFSSHLLLS
jgi:hypothetical protein